MRRPRRVRVPRPALRRVAAHAARGLAVAVPPLAAGLAAAIPVLNSTIKAVRAGWVPAGDDGIIATRGWDVLTSHTPLVGQYSEAGLVVRGQVMHSPGPMLYWLLALPARFGSVTSIAVTMCVLNTLAIIACVALARRRGGLALMFGCAIGIALMCRSLPTESMHDVWNPAAALLPFLLLIFLGWSLACGEHRLLPATVLVASFVTQTHLMYAAPTAVVLAVGLGGLSMRSLARRRRRRYGTGDEQANAARARVWPWAAAALILAAVCWAGPAIDELDNNPGNLTMIARTVEHRGPALGAAVGWHAVVRSIGVRPWWVYAPASEWERKLDVRATPSSAAESSAIALLAALALVGLIGAFVRRRDLTAAALIGLGLSAAIGLQAAANPSARLLAETLGYTMWWGSELGFWVWLVLAWALWLGLSAVARATLALVRGRRAAAAPASPQWRTVRVRAALVLAPLVCLGGVAGVAAVGGASAASAQRDSHVYEYRPIRAAAAGVERIIPAGRSIQYNLGPLDLGTQPMEPALRFLLVRHGDRVLADGSSPRLGTYYQLDHRPVQWVLYLADGTRRPRGMTLAARVSFFGPWGRETLSTWVRPVRRQAAEVRPRSRRARARAQRSGPAASASRASGAYASGRRVIRNGNSSSQSRR